MAETHDELEVVQRVPSITENKPITSISDKIIVEHKAVSLHQNVSEVVICDPGDGLCNRYNG